MIWIEECCANNSFEIANNSYSKTDSVKFSIELKNFNYFSTLMLRISPNKFFQTKLCSVSSYISFWKNRRKWFNIYTMLYSRTRAFQHGAHVKIRIQKNIDANLSPTIHSVGMAKVQFVNLSCGMFNIHETRQRFSRSVIIISFFRAISIVCQNQINCERTRLREFLGFEYGLLIL